MNQIQYDSAKSIVEDKNSIRRSFLSGEIDQNEFNKRMQKLLTVTQPGPGMRPSYVAQPLIQQRQTGPK